jgi:hypothetical protein
MKTKLFLLMFLFLFETLYLFSQEQKDTTNKQTATVQQIPQQPQGLKRVYEFGFTFSSLNNFGINFKMGNQKTLYRLSVLALNIGTGNLVNTGSINFNGLPLDTSVKVTFFGAGLSIGIEKRIFLAKNFYLLLGADAVVDYYSDKYENNTTNSGNWTRWRLAPGIDLGLGLAYQIGDHFIITAEISPSLSYIYEKQKLSGAAYNTDFTGHYFQFGLSNNSARVTIAYRILKTILFKW